MLQQMQNAGIEVEVFNPVHRYVNRIYFNYRDHRKIAVIDGYYAYTGGINIADEYANLIVRFGHWKDSAVRIEGEGAWGFAVQFIQMWKMMGRTLPNEDDYYRPRHDGPATQGFCQPFTDGPLNNPDNPIEETYLQLIASAKRMLYITTPYYAVEESMQKSLCIAADAGVDVRLLVPAIPDKKFAYVVAKTYWGELLAHGVKIYRYTPGFLHAKSVMVDREVALVGQHQYGLPYFPSCTTSAAYCFTTCRWWKSCWRTWTISWPKAACTLWRSGTGAPGWSGPLRLFCGWVPSGCKARIA